MLFDLCIVLGRSKLYNVTMDVAWRLVGTEFPQFPCSAWLMVLDVPPSLPPQDWEPGVLVSTTLQVADFLDYGDGCMTVAPKSLTMETYGFADWILLMCQYSDPKVQQNYIYAYIGLGYKASGETFTLSPRICI